MSLYDPRWKSRRLGDPPPWHAVYWAVVIARGSQPPVAVVWQTADEVFGVQVDAGKHVPGEIVPVRFFLGDNEGPTHVEILEENRWLMLRFESFPKRRPELVLPATD